MSSGRVGQSVDTKTALFTNLTKLRIDSSSWEIVAADRSVWQQMCFLGVYRFEETPTENICTQNNSLVTVTRYVIVSRHPCIAHIAPTLYIQSLQTQDWSSYSCYDAIIGGGHYAVCASPVKARHLRVEAH